MKMSLPAVALSLLALATTAPEAAASDVAVSRTTRRAPIGDVLELRNDWRRPVVFTVSRADHHDPYEFRLRDGGRRAYRDDHGHSRLEVGPVRPGRTASVAVLPDGRVKGRDQRGRVLVTVRGAGHHGRVLDRYTLSVDLRGDRRGNRHDHGHDGDWRDERRDRRDDCRLERERRNDELGRDRRRGDDVGSRPRLGRPFELGDFLRITLANRYRD